MTRRWKVAAVATLVIVVLLAVAAWVGLRSISFGESEEEVRQNADAEVSAAVDRLEDSLPGFAAPSVRPALAKRLLAMEIDREHGRVRSQEFDDGVYTFDVVLEATDQSGGGLSYHQVTVTRCFAVRVDPEAAVFDEHPCTSEG